VAVLRFPYQHGVRAIVVASLLALAACASEAPVRTAALQVPPPEPARSCLVVLGFSPQAAGRCDQAARRELKGAVTKALLDSKRFRVIETEVVVSSEPMPLEARRVAGRAGADLVALLRLHHFELRTGVHHVRHYHDGSATGELVLIDVKTGVIERAARQTVHLSTRARYASAAYARDLVLTRLAERLGRELLGLPPTAQGAS